MSMDQWSTVWQTVMVTGLVAYYVVAAAVIPLGARDVVRLFSRLEAPGRDDDREETS